jgi:hypothetical protein
MVLQTPADFTGTGATVTLATIAFGAGANNPLWAKIVQVNANGAGVRVGDKNTAIGRGMPVQGSQFIPPISEPTEQLDLNSVYVYVPSGVVVNVLYIA